MTLLSVLACMDVSLTAHPDPGVQVWPTRIEAPPAACSDHLVVLTGRDTLLALAWMGDAGHPDEVALPALGPTAFDGELAFDITLCPSGDLDGLVLVETLDAGLLSLPVQTLSEEP